MGQLKSQEDYINEAKLVHNNRYDYSKVEYLGVGKKVCIICHEKDQFGNEHGEFWQQAGSHIQGVGCPKCAGLKRLDTEEFIRRSKRTHGDRYDYTKTIYKNKRTKVIITCPIHGDFEQDPKNHYNGQGCPKCGKKYAQEYRKFGYVHYADLSKERFDDTYEFPNIAEEYENMHSVITLKCKKCGTVFKKIACDHITSSFGGCPKCYQKRSKGEEEIGDFIESILKDEKVIFRDRDVLNGNELDIYIPNYNLAIEYDGLYWHTEEHGKNKNYHLLKTEICNSKGIGLIHIFEDELKYHKDIVFNKILHILGIQQKLPKIMGRKCVIKEIDYKTSSTFLDNYHIQGNIKATVYLGAFFENKLIGVMTFKKELNNSEKWELSRFSSNYNYICQGVGGKILNYFIKKYQPKEIKSFADRRWTLNEKNNLYTKLGFEFDKYLAPDYKYVVNDKRIHKFNFRKNQITKKYDVDENLTESKMMKQIGINKIWDCGLIKYIWRNNNG